MAQAELDNAGNQGVVEMRVPCPDAYGEPLSRSKFQLMWRRMLPYVKVHLLMIIFGSIPIKNMLSDLIIYKDCAIIFNKKYQVKS